MASVDIAIPCYQHGRFLRQCILSVLDQGVDDLRVLVIDNASTDDSVEVARELARRDSRVEIVVHPTNLGPHASFNEGVDWATADYLMILCSDDIVTAGSLARLISALEHNPDAAFAYGLDRHWNGEGEAPLVARPDEELAPLVRTGQEFIHDQCLNLERYIATGMVLVRSSAQKRAGHFRPELEHTDDVEMLLRLARIGSVVHVPCVVGIKRMHRDNRTQHLLGERTRNLLALQAALESFLDLTRPPVPDARHLRRLGLRGIAERAYWCGMKDLVRGRLRNAAALFALAVRLSPRTVLVPPVNYLLRSERSILEVFR